MTRFASRFQSRFKSRFQGRFTLGGSLGLTFNGSNSYGLILDTWEPQSYGASIETDFVVIDPGSGLTNNIIAGINNYWKIYSNTAPNMLAQYRDTAAANQVIIFESPSEANVRYTGSFTLNLDGAVTDLGSGGTNPGVPDIEADQIYYVGRSIGGYANVKINSFSLNDPTTLQNGTFVVGDGSTVYCQLEEIELTGDFEVEAYIRREGSTGSSAILGQSASADNRIVVYGSTHATTPNQVRIRLDATDDDFSSALADIPTDKDYLLKFVRTGTTGEVFIDGVSQGTATVSGNTVTFDTIGVSNSVLYFRQPIGQLTVTDKSGPSDVVHSFDTQLSPRGVNDNVYIALDSGDGNFETAVNYTLNNSAAPNSTIDDVDACTFTNAALFELVNLFDSAGETQPGLYIITGTVSSYTSGSVILQINGTNLTTLNSTGEFFGALHVDASTPTMFLVATGSTTLSLTDLRLFNLSAGYWEGFDPNTDVETIARLSRNYSFNRASTVYIQDDNNPIGAEIWDGDTTIVNQTGTWTDNGDGSYTHTGSGAPADEIRRHESELVEGELYLVACRVTGTGGDNVNIKLGGVSITGNNVTFTQAEGIQQALIRAENVSLGSLEIRISCQTEATDVSDISVKLAKNAIQLFNVDEGDWS